MTFSRSAALPLGLVLALGAPAAGAAQAPPQHEHAAHAASALPRAVPNDQRSTAGRMVNGELRIQLEAVETEWYPRGPDGPRVVTPAFAEAGSPAQVPGPLIRAAAGTPIRVSVRNRLQRTIMVRGLQSRDSMQTSSRPAEVPPWLPNFLFADSIVLAPGESREVSFTPRAELSSFYFARVQDAEGEYKPRSFVPGGAYAVDGAFVGAIVIDPPSGERPANERVMVITRWGSPDEPGTRHVAAKFFLNGLSWPHTERLEHTVGDTVHWRVINTSHAPHPMHMHGFYFTVNGRGNGDVDSIYTPDKRPSVVTDLVGDLSSMRLTWVPSEPGNWLFHCHFIRHMGPIQRFAAEGGAPDPAHDHDMDHMAGLVTGVTVRPAAGWTDRDPVAERRLDLWTGQRDNVFGDKPALGFIRQEGAVPAADSVLVPGSPLVLVRGQATEIMVHNRFATPLSVHWHGLEVRSLYDGVGHWSGQPGAGRPPIAPGDSASVVIQPPRAGTFMYHVHGELGSQLAQGLYGPLLVLEPGETWNPERDRLFVLSSGGAEMNAPPSLNGQVSRERPISLEGPRPANPPAPPEVILEYPTERFEPGQTYRLRFITISPDETKVVRIRRANGQMATWTPVAKDAAELPAGLRAPQPARVVLGSGETYDFAWTPTEPGVYVMEVINRFYASAQLSAVFQRVAFTVGDVPADAQLAAIRALAQPPAPPAGARPPAAGAAPAPGGAPATAAPAPATPAPAAAAPARPAQP